MHKCKCVYCQNIFDRDKLPFVQISERRYAHKECADKFQSQKTQDEKDYDALADYIEKLFGVGYISAKIAKQIKDMRTTYGYTYSGMLGTLMYWYEVRGGVLEKANGGVGIVPYKYDEAKEYYLKIQQANQINANIKGFKTKVTEITIEPPKPEERKPRLFNLEEEE
jgi:hypothetical protein